MIQRRETEGILVAGKEVNIFDVEKIENGIISQETRRKNVKIRHKRKDIRRKYMKGEKKGTINKEYKGKEMLSEERRKKVLSEENETKQATQWR